MIVSTITFDNVGEIYDRINSRLHTNGNFIGI